MKSLLKAQVSTKRIQTARGWCATVGGGMCKLYPPTPPLRRPGHPIFWGSQPCVPAAWLAEHQLLTGDIESNPGPKPTLKTLSHTRTQPPDLIFASESIANMCKKSVMDPNPHTQHRPICVRVQPVVVPQPTPFRRRFNFRKADWNGYSTELDNRR